MRRADQHIGEVAHAGLDSRMDDERYERRVRGNSPYRPGRGPDAGNRGGVDIAAYEDPRL